MKTVRTKLFQNGGSQAGRLPKECRFTEQGGGLVRREGRRVILEAADEWPDKFRAWLGALPGRIPRPKQRRGRGSAGSVACWATTISIPSPSILPAAAQDG